MQYKIIEIEIEDTTGYSVISPFKRMAEFIGYDEARAMVEEVIKENDTIVEIYVSGNEAHYTASKFLAEMEQIRQKYGVVK